MSTGSSPAAATVLSDQADVFISYNEHDAEWVNSYLLPHMEDAELRVLIYPRDFLVGATKLQCMEQAVDRTRHTLVVLTEHWLANDWNVLDGFLASADDPASRRRRVLPVMLQKCALPRHMSLINHADFTNEDGWKAEMQRLLTSLKTQSGSPGSSGISEQDAREAREGFRALEELMDRYEVKKAVQQYAVRLSITRKQIDVLSCYKKVHDQVHSLQVHCYNPIVRELRNFPTARIVWHTLGSYERDIENIVESLKDIAANPSLETADHDWFKSLERTLTSCRDELSNAIQTTDPNNLNKAAWSINRVLSKHPSTISKQLTKLARDLKLDDLEAAMTQMCEQLTVFRLDQNKLDQVKLMVVALGSLGQDLNQLCTNHDLWQDFDDDLRRIEHNLDHDPMQELEWSWPDLKTKGQQLYADKAETWATTFQKEAERLEKTVGEAAELQKAVAAKQRKEEELEKLVETLVAAFQDYRACALQSFYRVDRELLRHCGKLTTIKTPIDSILGRI